MAVEIAHNRRPARPFCTQRGDQRDRVDFEVEAWVRGDVARGLHRFDNAVGPEQQPAHFARRIGSGQRQHRLPGGG